ncbi:MAG: RhuM family protein [Bacteroidales bacterium]|nr:RhuM family protein [Bacteroidales bacterium]MDD4545505.1 RhuM family protein [Bacteroidales bacterium]
MGNKIEIYKTSIGAEVSVQLETDTVWLDAHNIAEVFGINRPAIVKHIGNIYKSGELEMESTCSILEQVAADGKKRKMNFYNLDMILSVGYRINSSQATKFRQWATSRLKDYLVQGYTINEKRLHQKQQEVEFLKTGLRIVSRALENAANEQEQEVFHQFAKGLELLDDYDHEELDNKGYTLKETVYPTYKDYMNLISLMYSDFKSDVFAKPKDNSFHSSINQIKQSFGETELYPSIEEKAANLLYYITKNHSFVDGNKRIAASCFLYFLQRNNSLINSRGEPLISNDTLASLTLFIANSKPEENEIVKRLIISILNRNK